jgi:hypothetical protein
VWLRRVLDGYYRYHAVHGNLRVLGAIRTEIAQRWYRSATARGKSVQSWIETALLDDLLRPIMQEPYSLEERNLQIAFRDLEWPSLEADPAEIDFRSEYRYLMVTDRLERKVPDMPLQES